MESVEALIGHQVVAEPTAAPIWTRAEATTAKNAALRVYLGAAPGVGKTYAMLSEGRRRAERGTRVVVGCVETYGRPRTLEMLAGPGQVPTARGELSRTRSSTSWMSRPFDRASPRSR